MSADERDARINLVISIVCPFCGYDPFVKRSNGQFGCAKCGKEMSGEALVKLWTEHRDLPIARSTVTHEHYPGRAGKED